MVDDRDEEAVLRFRILESREGSVSGGKISRHSYAINE